jgi:hypothetical protein
MVDPHMMLRIYPWRDSRNIRRSIARDGQEDKEKYVEREQRE